MLVGTAVPCPYRDSCFICITFSIFVLYCVILAPKLGVEELMSVEQTTQLIQLILNSVLMIVACAFILAGLLLRRSALEQRLQTTSLEYCQVLHLAYRSQGDRLLLLKKQLRHLQQQVRLAQKGTIAIHYAFMVFVASTFTLSLRTVVDVAWLITAALGAIHSPAIDLALAGVGWFDHGPRGALFARVAPVDPLAALHIKLDRALVQAGLEPERRAYMPHITLARRRTAAVDPAGWLERNAALASRAEQIGAMILFESHLGRHGSSYEAIASYPLTG